MNTEAARQMVENLQACKGRGKMRVEPKMSQPSNKNLYPVQLSISGYSAGDKHSNSASYNGTSSWPVQNGKTFQSSYAEVFKNRRGMFEQGNFPRESRNHKTLDDISLAVPSVTSFSKQSKLVTKPKGSKVQFEESHAKDNVENCHIANHYGKRVSHFETVKSDHNSPNHNNAELTNKTQHINTTNIDDTCHAPFWKPLARSRTAPNLDSSPGSVTYARNKFEEQYLVNAKEPNKVSSADDPNDISNAMDDSKDNLLLPKVPTRKLSSHKSVVQFKKNKFEVDDKDKLNTTEPENNLSLNKSKMANLTKDMKRNELFENDNCENEDDNDNFNWRPLRDFF